MLQYFMNPAMLIGLAGLTLPVIAHLLSKKKYDIIEWGAMQFLELGRNAQRKIKLEELLLLLVRMLMIGLIAIALARPWAKNGFLGRVASAQSRDVIFIIDGSYSMGWEGDAETPHVKAMAWVRQYLKQLRSGDTIGLIDARDHVRVVIESPTRDFKLVREQLDKLPPPAGSSNLAEALNRAVQILSTTSNLSREVIVLTDGQSKGWVPDDTVLWTRFDDRLQQPKQRPRLWVLNTGTDNVAEQTNFHIESLQLSREMAVPDFPIQVRTKVHFSGGTKATSRNVHLEIDGQRIDGKMQVVPLEPNGEASVEFEYRFPAVGSHVISAVLDDDNLPGDNRADAAVNIASPPPVLLIDGDPQLNPVKQETKFIRDALTPSINPNPWVQAEVVNWDQFPTNRLTDYEAVVLANVRRLTPAQTGALKDYVSRGGGLFITLGDRVEAANYEEQLWENGEGLLPAKLISIEKDEDEEGPGVHVINDSLELPFMQRFRTEFDGGFTEARFDQWWKVMLPEKKPETDEDSPPDSDTQEREGEEKPITISTPLLAAKLQSGDPLLVTRRYGRGGVVLMTSSVDADWTTLVSKHDFVSLMHEIVFHLASAKERRNVDVGIPLIVPVESQEAVKEYHFTGPGETKFEPEPAGDELTPLARLSETQLSGVYRFEKLKPKVNDLTDYFVVNFDRGESNLTPLTDEQKDFLSENERMAFVESLEELAERMFADDSRSEFWHLLLLLFLFILVVEVYMTRRLVKGGHAAAEPEEGQLVPLVPVTDNQQKQPEKRTEKPKKLAARTPRPVPRPPAKVPGKRGRRRPPQH